MPEFMTVKDILDYAIMNEEKAVQMYRALAAKAKSPGMKKSLEAFAQEEEGHKRALLRVKEGQVGLDANAKVPDIKVGDYLKEPKPAGDLSYQDALILAMKQEKEAYRLYTSLAELATDAKIKETFLGLAQEEAKHKLRFETEYDDEFYREN